MVNKNQELYDFEEIKSSNANAKKRLIIDNKIIVAIVIVCIHILIGIRWRYSLGGKMILINCIVFLIPYFILCKRGHFKQKIIETLTVLLTTIFAWTVAIYGYSQDATGTLTVDAKQIELATNSNVNFILKENGVSRYTDGLNIKSKNSKIANIFWQNSIYSEEAGTTTLTIFDDYGHSVDIKVISKMVYPKTFEHVGNNVINVNSNDIFDFYTASNAESNMIFKMESTNKEVADFYGLLYGLQEGTSTIKTTHDIFPELESEIIVVGLDEYIVDQCFTSCNGYRIGKPIDILATVPEGAKNIEIDADPNYYKLENGLWIPIKEGLGPVKVSYDDVSYEINLPLMNEKIQAITLKNVTGDTITLKEPINLDVKTYPETVKVDKISYRLQDPTIASIDDKGVLRPLSQGTTRLVISVADREHHFTINVPQGDS